jgi:hypothetical protein
MSNIYLTPKQSMTSVSDVQQLQTEVGEASTPQAPPKSEDNTMHSVVEHNQREGTQSQMLRQSRLKDMSQ